MGLVLVERRTRDLRIGDERRQVTGGPGVGEHLEIEVCQRHHSADAVLGAQLGERRDIPRIVEPRNGAPDVRRVLGGRERSSGSAAITVVCWANAETIS